jgi:hypothetical protein
MKIYPVITYRERYIEKLADAFLQLFVEKAPKIL